MRGLARVALARIALAGVALALLTVAACGRERATTSAASASTAAAAAAIHHPVLDGVEAAARQQLEAQRERVATLERGGAGGPALGRAYGELGRLYHAYGLLPAAREAYAAAAAREPGELRWLYLGAVAARQAGDLAAAVAGFTATLERAAQNAPAALQLGESELDLNHPREALAAFEKARQADPACALAAGLGSGRAHLAAGEAAVAADELAAVLEADPTAGKARYPLALALRSLGRTAEAQALLAAGAQGEPACPDPWLDELQVLAEGGGAAMREGGKALMSGQLAAAEAAFRKAVAADPDLIEARRNLAVALVRQSRPREAVAVLEAGLGSHADDPGLLFDLGTALLAAGDVSAAVDRFERVLTVAPTYSSARFNLANVLISQGRWGEAAPHLEALVAADPRDGKARYLLAMSRAQLGDRAGAEGALRQLVTDEPRLLPARKALASLLGESGQLVAAQRLLEDALALDLPAADRASVLAALAAMAARRSERRQAEELYRRAIASAAGSAEAHQGLAELLLAGGRPGEAAAEFALAARALPPTTPPAEAAVPLLGHALALSRAGRQAELAQALEAAASRFPQDGRVQLTLARFLATCPEARHRDGRRALALAEGLYRAQASLAVAEVVAMAQAAVGDFAAAARWQRELLARLPIGAPPTVRERLAADLRLYEQGKPVARPLD